MKNIGKPVKETESYLKREDYYQNLIRKLQAEKENVQLGGGKRLIDKHKAKGKLTARERINLLVDNPVPSWLAVGDLPG